ncbi:hypothetical protein AX761_20920 [Rhizobium sp. 58]|nr:hypothetical protein AX761_20920 [Rhizobium sp. 58]
MTERINTTLAAFITPAFSPTAEWTVQAQIDTSSKGYVDVEAQADADAPWVQIGSLNALSSPPMLHFAKVPGARLKAYNNEGGYTLKAWSGE